MSNLTTLPDGAVPAHIAARPGVANQDLSGGVSAGFGQISYKGKVWHLVDGQTRSLLADPTTGDPKASIELVIAKANPHIAKVYYPQGYEEGSTEKPTCYSNDGVAPMLDSTVAQSTKCAICPHNQWGSKITETGAKGKACADSRRLAVVAPSDLTQLGDEAKAWLLRVPAGSLKELVAYADNLNRRQAPYNSVVTKVSFDHTVAHPKFKFTAVRWLTEQEMAVVDEITQKEVVAQILGGAGATVAEAAQNQDHGLDALGPRPEPAAVPQATPSPAPQPAQPAAQPAAPAPAPAVVSGFGATVTEVTDVLKSAPSLTPTTAAAPQSDLLAEADASLDAVLAGLDTPA